MKTIRFLKLKKGDAVGIVTVSEPVTLELRDLFDKGKIAIEKEGYSVIVGKHALSNPEYPVAATPKERAEDINQFFKDKSIKAIFCTTGGYNSNEILDFLDYRLIGKNPKIFCGLSDPTAILNAIYKKTGLITLHGPVVLWDFGVGIHNYTKKYFNKAISGNPIGPIEEFSEWVCLKHGKAKGRLVGGNLATLQKLIGTEFEPDWRNKIFFWEAISKQPHELQAILVQLKQRGVFNKINGMVVGKCVSCENRLYKKAPNLINVIKNVCENYIFPILYNVDLGHTPEKITIPIGALATIVSQDNYFSID